ncbi:MAG TPA: peptidoglycan DD-metalloendopeptidase family protein [Elusimicrobiota bacterium]|nr:peptidoglycan DD-metalloendopeptidase family protein [Elusimicrobiota bacterium]
MTPGGLLTLLLAAAPARAQSSVDRRKLESLRAQIEAKRQEIETARRKEDELGRDLGRLRSEKEGFQRRLRELEDGRKRAEVQKRELGDHLAALTMAEGKGRVLLSGEFSRYVQELQSDSPEYGRAGLWRESYRRAALREKTGYLSRLRAFQAQTAQARAQALARDRDLRQRAEKTSAELRSRQESYQKKEERYKEAHSQTARSAQELRELEESAKALTNLVKGLERRGGAPAAAGALAIPRYSLPWPVPGRVVARFGKERVPQLDSWVIRSGIEIATERDASVHAVERGKVIFAGPFRSYGKVLIVDHERGLYTIYGHLQELLVGKGQAVTSDSRIAVAGAAGSGGTLYFEIRKGAEALDPLQWLKKP